MRSTPIQGLQQATLDARLVAFFLSRFSTVNWACWMDMEHFQMQLETRNEHEEKFHMRKSKVMQRS